MITDRLPLSFMAGCLARTPFRDLVTGASGAGFGSLSIWPNIWRHAQRKQGLSLSDMRAMLDDYGLTLTDIDAYRDWVPPPRADGGRFGPTSAGVELGEILDVASALGARTIVAVHLTDVPLDLARETDAFARLCEAAGAWGLRVALEFIAFSAISDAATAWHVVEASGQANGGLVVDLWHHLRGVGLGNDALIRAIPPQRIFTVQYCDASARSDISLVEEAMFHRRMPGDGAFNVPGFLRMLAEMGVEAPCGPELYARDFESRAPAEVMRDLAGAGRRILAAAEDDSQ